MASVGMAENIAVRSLLGTNQRTSFNGIIELFKQRTATQQEKAEFLTQFNIASSGVLSIFKTTGGSN